MSSGLPSSGKSKLVLIIAKYLPENDLPCQGWRPDNNLLILFFYFRCGGQQDVKDVSETTKSIQMTRIVPDMQVLLDQQGTRMTGK